MRHVPQLVLAAGTLLIAACQQQAEPPAGPTPEPTATVSAAPGPAPSPNPTTTANEVTLTSSSVILVNAVEGRGAATTLGFGMAQANALAAMREDFGAPVTSANAECGAGPMEFAKFGALTLNFLDGKLVGWLAERADNLVTSDGIRPGIALDDLRAERPVQMANDTLEGEFGYAAPDGGTIGGFVDRQDRVISLNAGVQCFFR